MRWDTPSAEGVSYHIHAGSHQPRGPCSLNSNAFATHSGAKSGPAYGLFLCGFRDSTRSLRTQGLFRGTAVIGIGNAELLATILPAPFLQQEDRCSGSIRPGGIWLLNFGRWPNSNVDEKAGALHAGAPCNKGRKKCRRNTGCGMGTRASWCPNLKLTALWPQYCHGSRDGSLQAGRGAGGPCQPRAPRWT